MTLGGEVISFMEPFAGGMESGPDNIQLYRDGIVKKTGWIQGDG